MGKHINSHFLYVAYSGVTQTSEANDTYHRLKANTGSELCRQALKCSVIHCALEIFLTSGYFSRSLLEPLARSFEPGSLTSTMFFEVILSTYTKLKYGSRKTFL